MRIKRWQGWKNDESTNIEDSKGDEEQRMIANLPPPNASCPHAPPSSVRSTYLSIVA